MSNEKIERRIKTQLASKYSIGLHSLRSCVEAKEGGGRGYESIKMG